MLMSTFNVFRGQKGWNESRGVVLLWHACVVLTRGVSARIESNSVARLVALAQTSRFRKGLIFRYQIQTFA